MNLQKNSYQVNLNKEKAGIPKWLQQKLKAEGKAALPSRLYEDMHRTNPKAMNNQVPEPPKKPVQ